ncbi:MAG TPA: hypothetical protein EYH54_01300 [Nautiliaceae bacterium]|nr:hypothetical protein [Nautiliaceae bacterium]
MIIKKELKKDFDFIKERISYYLKESLFGKYRLLFYFMLLLLIIELINFKIGSFWLATLNYLAFLILFVYLFPSFYLNKISKELKKNIKNFLKTFFTWLVTFLFYNIIFIILLVILLYFYLTIFNQALNTNNIERILSIFIFQPIYFVFLFIIFLFEIYLVVFLPLNIIKNIEKDFFSLIGKSIISIKDFFNFKAIVLLLNIIILIYLLFDLRVYGIFSIFLLVYVSLVYYLFSYLVLFLYYYYFIEKKDKEKIHLLNLILLITGLVLILIKGFYVLDSDKTLLLLNFIFLLFSFPFTYLMWINFPFFLIFLLSL